jgi:hypothetical protein
LEGAYVEQIRQQSRALVRGAYVTRLASRALKDVEEEMNSIDENKE